MIWHVQILDRLCSNWATDQRSSAKQYLFGQDLVPPVQMLSLYIGEFLMLGRRTHKTFSRYLGGMAFAVVSLMVLGFSSKPVWANTSCDVEVDCSTHEITVLGETTRIDCGKPGHVTHNGVGKIGGYHHGRIVPNGIEIEGIPGMGASGGGKVFHSVSWGPRGLNQSNGCIHVIPRVRDTLHRCQGSSIRITGANSGYQEPRSYRRTHRHRRHHRRHRHYRSYDQQDSESYQ